MPRAALANEPSRAAQARRGLLTLVSFTAVLWLILLVDLATGGVMNYLFGNIPRRLEGLDGVLFAPLLHADFNHLASNSLPLIVLGFLVFLEGVRRFVAVAASRLSCSAAGASLSGPRSARGASGGGSGAA